MNGIEIPAGAVETASGIRWLDEETGILMAVGRNHAIHTLEHALENHAVHRALARGMRRPLLIDISEVKGISRGAREFYAGPEPQKVFTAMAILATTTVGNMVGKLLLGFTNPEFPTDLFAEHDKAVEWLMQYKEENKA